MSAPLSIRLDDDVRKALAAEAKARGISLSSYLQHLADAEASRLRRARIRAASSEVASHVAASADAQEFIEDWGKIAFRND